MKNLFRPLCLVTLLAVGPATLIGCSGGSSSNRSDGATRADLAFSTPETPNVINPTKVRGTFRPQGEFDGQPDFTRGNGVYSSYVSYSNSPEGWGVMSNAVLLNNSTENRFLRIDRFVTSGTAETVGTVYDIVQQTPGTIGIRFTRNFKTSTPAADYLASSGTVTVTAVNGSFITLELKDVQLVTLLSEGNPATLQLNGTITYNRNNIVILPPSMADVESGGKLKR